MHSNIIVDSMTHVFTFAAIVRFPLQTSIIWDKRDLGSALSVSMLQNISFRFRNGQATD